MTELERTVEYSYDSLYRLTSETVTEGEDVVSKLGEFSKFCSNAGLPKKYLRDFGDYIEDVKRQFGKRNDANFTYKELVDLAKEFMEDLR